MAITTLKIGTLVKVIRLVVPAGATGIRDGRAVPDDPVAVTYRNNEEAAMTTQLHHLQVAVTSGALRAMEESGQEWDFFVGLHLSGIWGELDDKRCRHNAEALKHGGPLLSAYRTLKGRDLLVVTDAAHAVTKIFLADER